MNQAEVVTLLKNARFDVHLAELLPAPFKLTVGAHDTGCQPYIWARAEGMPQVLVWQGSIWYSPAYDFNDKDKILGYQPGCEWAKPVLDTFFENVANAHATAKAKRALAEVERRSSTIRKHNDAVEYYKNLVSGATPPEDPTVEPPRSLLWSADDAAQRLYKSLDPSKSYHVVLSQFAKALKSAYQRGRSDEKAGRQPLYQSASEKGDE